MGFLLLGRKGSSWAWGRAGGGVHPILSCLTETKEPQGCEYKGTAFELSKGSRLLGFFFSPIKSDPRPRHWEFSGETQTEEKHELLTCLLPSECLVHAGRRR